MPIRDQNKKRELTLKGLTHVDPFDAVSGNAKDASYFKG